MRPRFLLLGILALLARPFHTHAQDVREQTWLSYLTQTRLTAHSGIWLDGNLRLGDDYVKGVVLWLYRAGYIYYWSDNLRLVAGYGHTTDIGTPNIPEDRMWEQVQFYHQWPGARMMQYLRFEENFKRKVEDGGLADAFDYKTRLRYNLQFTSKCLGGKSVGPFVYANNEIFFTLNEPYVQHPFDQDRISAGLGYRFTKLLNMQAGYLFGYQQGYGSARSVRTRAIRLAVYHTIDLRKSG